MEEKTMDGSRRWRVRMAGSDQPTMTFDTAEEALAYAKGLASRRNAPRVRIKKRG